jgi:type IV pilus assembly protein PilP
MDKIIYYAAWMLAAVFILAWTAPAVAIPEDGIHVSNRVKIERPEILVAPDAVLHETPEAVKVTRPEPVIPKPKPDAPPEAAKEMVSAPEGPATTETQDIVIAPAVEDPLASQLPGRFYSRAGRMDPFEPFLYRPEPEVTPTEQEQLQIRAPQTPLERMDLAQLRLTGIMRAPGRIHALVEEASGKGYVVVEGTYIGNKGGQISKILPDRVVVEEKYLDIYGKIAVREKELKLQN